MWQLWKLCISRGIQLSEGWAYIQAGVLVLPDHNLRPLLHVGHCVLGEHDHIHCHHRSHLWRVATFWYLFLEKHLLSIIRWVSGSTRTPSQRECLSGWPPFSPCPPRSHQQRAQNQSYDMMKLFSRQSCWNISNLSCLAHASPTDSCQTNFNNNKSCESNAPANQTVFIHLTEDEDVTIESNLLRQVGSQLSCLRSPTRRPSTSGPVPARYNTIEKRQECGSHRFQKGA